VVLDVVWGEPGQPQLIAPQNAVLDACEVRKVRLDTPSQCEHPPSVMQTRKQRRRSSTGIRHLSEPDRLLAHNAFGQV
jgi:hypothetical protein